MPNMPRVPYLTAEQIRGWRFRLGVSQFEAGRLMGIAVRTYGKYESGEQAISKSIALSCWAIEEACKRKGQPTYDQVEDHLNEILRKL